MIMLKTLVIIIIIMSESAVVVFSCQPNLEFFLSSLSKNHLLHKVNESEHKLYRHLITYEL